MGCRSEGLGWWGRGGAGAFEFGFEYGFSCVGGVGEDVGVAAEDAVVGSVGCIVREDIV